MTGPEDTVGPEAELILRIARGDTAALRELYDALSGNVFALAIQMTDSREDAEEVVQDTFVNVHDNADRYDPARGSARAWIYTIARNECRMRLRKRSSRPKKADAVDLHEPGVPLAADPVGASHEDRIVVQRALNRLDDDEADLLEMAYFGGFSHREIADTTDRPLGTIKSRIRRALLKLRDFLDDPLPPPSPPPTPAPPEDR